MSSTNQSFQRPNPDGFRLQFGGMNTVNPPDQMPPNKYPYAQNVRSYVRQRVGPRAAQDAAVEVVSGSVHSIRRLNDTTPNGPASGYVLVTGAGQELYISSESAPVSLGAQPRLPFSLVISPTTANFGYVSANTVVNIPITITLEDPQNTGAVVHIQGISLGASIFYLSPFSPQTLTAGQSYTFSVYINQPSAGNFTDTIAINTNIGFYYVPVSAVVTNFSVQPTTLNFGSMAANVTASLFTTITFNDPTGGSTGTLSTYSLIQTSNTFSLQNAPIMPVTLANGHSVSFQVNALQATPGTYTATLNLVTNLGTYTVNITATIVAAAGNITVVPPQLNFGNQLVGVAAPSTSFVITNNSGATVNLSGPVVANSAFYMVNPPTFPHALANGASLTVTMGVTPAKAGPDQGYITINTDSLSFVQIMVNMYVTGTGTAGNISVVPSSLDFGSGPVGTPIAGKTVTITNNFGTAVSLNSAAMSNADFYLESAPFPYILANGTSLTIAIGVTPSNPTRESGTLSITTDAANFNPLTITMQVVGIGGGGGVGGPAIFSGNPLSMIPFRPNASPQPWMYIGDSVAMEKVRSDGTIYRVGIEEPQLAPQTQIIPASDVISTVGPITVTYWGDSPHTGPTGNYIWKHASDTNAYGPVRATTPASGATTGNSVIFDVPAFAGTPLPSGFAAPGSPMLWFQYDVYNGIVTTGVDANGPFAEWDSGDQFGGLVAGDAIIIGGVSFVIAASPIPNNTRVYLTTSAGTQQDINYSAAIVGGPSNLFVPPLESEGYSDFNFSLTGTFYVPAAGVYTFFWQSKDESLFGIGNSGVGTASWSPASAYPGAQLSLEGQSVTSINGYPLLPKTVVYDGGGQYNHGGAHTGTGLDNGYSGVAVTFSQPGNYPFEINYDYWYHSGRILHMECLGPAHAQGPNPLDIPPLPLDVITNASYRYTYRSSATGATSNPSPESPQQNFSVLSTNITPAPSPDPQVDKIDIYRMDSGLLNFTYVGTIANNPTNPQVFDDKLLDTDVSGNPLLQFDNFEPFPSIDLPRAGTANVLDGGILQSTGGDAFNVRWLPGTIILVGTIAFTLNKRPSSSTQLTCSNVNVVQGVEQVVYPDPASGVSWAIQEPILAAQRLPYLWGPTDNVSFFFACGDPLRPGTLYWSKGNQPDSAPDTNQQDVTSPSEPLMNGCITNGLGMVFSTERAWIIIPNFFNAQATIEGNVGSTWTLQETIANRGLYMPWCLAVDGGGNVYFRAKDGVYVSPSGQGSQSITDPDLFNIFPHEGVDRKLTPITIGVAPNAYTVFPPDDSQPAFQNMHFANGYLYYDYRDASSIPRTLVYDVAAGGWVVDVYQNPVRTHVLEEGVVNGTLVGTVNGQVQPLTGTGAEIATAVLLMPSFDAGDVRAKKLWGDLYVEAEAGSVK